MSKSGDSLRTADSSVGVVLANDIDQLLRDKASSFSDSLNHASVDKLPAFLYDPDFDYRDTFLLTAGTFRSEQRSLRIEIFKKVDRRDILEVILNDQFLVNQFKSKTRRFDIYSNADLARLRLMEIDLKIDTLSKLQ